jgi:hypothetical protein
MEPFADLINILAKTLRVNGRPLSLKALVSEVNRNLADRPMLESAIEKILNKNSNLFVETSQNEWAMREWNPTNTGLSTITPTGSKNPWARTSGRIERFQPLSEPLENLARIVLDQLVPVTQDRPTLDELSVFHIVQSSFKPNRLLREATDANCLVPPKLYEQTKNLSWRFPPMMRTTFFVRTVPGVHPKLSVRAVFGVGSFIEYQEWRPFGETQRTQRRYISSPEVNTPRAFANIKLNDASYFIREDTEATDFCRKSAQAVFYEAVIAQTVEADSITEFELPEIQTSDSVIKAYDEVNRKSLQVNQVDFFKPEGLDKQIAGSDSPRWALAVLQRGGACVKLSIATKAHDDWGVTEVTLTLSNEFRSDRTHADDEYILLHSVIFPHLYVAVSDAECVIGPQQHEECLQEAHSLSHLSSQEQFIAELTTQTNCVLTRSTKIQGELVVTPFGIYDTIRLDPVSGPKFSALCTNIDSLISLSSLSEIAVKYLRSSSHRSACLLAVLRAIQRAFRGPTGNLENLYAYQWKAIQNRIEILASGSRNQTTVIRAPTGAGKTLVFFANAAIHFLFTGQRAVMTFPTRILNEDMFKRLTRFVYALREEMQSVDPQLVDRINGGILIGTSDPSYNAIANPKPDQLMVQYDGCPKCQERGVSKKVICQEVVGRMVGVCEDEKCKHKITYMAGPKEVGDLLPALTIATPDKLFYEATIRAPQKALRFFGAPCIRCKCGYHISLLNKAGQVDDTLVCSQCGQTIDKAQAFKAGVKVLPKLVKSPPLYFVLDEIHSLYGITATLISYFFSLLREMAKSFNAEYEPTFETGTATIANERELIEAVTHQEMMLFPNEKEFFDYFKINPDRVRYRTLVFMPVGKATRSTITNSILSGYSANQSGGVLEQSVGKRTEGAYDFLLAYIPRKVNGYIVANELRRVLDDKSITFLSGDAPTARLVTLLQDIFDRKTDLLLANMVVSLGIDIPRLNNMLMLGVPKSMTEMVQTVGRTGRGRYSGHVVIHLQPSIPRDEFVYRHFHRVMGDVTGYFDRKPVAAVNTYVADLMFVNVLHALLSTRLSEDYRNAFCNRSGEWLAVNNNSRAFLGRVVKEVLGRGGTADLQREVALAIQPRLRDIVFELSTGRDLLFKWIESRPDALYSLRTRADRIPVAVAQNSLLEEMKRGIARDLRPVESDSDGE